MIIRKAEKKDTKYIRSLLEQLGCLTEEGFVEDKLDLVMNHPDQTLLVYESDKNVIAFISLHFVPQIELSGDLAIITYFAVDQIARSEGIGKKMESYCTSLSKERKCNRIEVHCGIRRVGAHLFYERQGYKEIRKYFRKKLD